MSKLGESFDKLPPAGKIIIVIAGVAVSVGALLVIGVPIYKQIKKAFQNKNENKEINTTESEIKDLESGGEKASYPDSQYLSWADSLKQAFDGCGTSTTAVGDIFVKLKNEVDLKKLNVAYGVRTYDACNWTFNFGDFTGTLGQALVNELAPADLQWINKLLRVKKINFQY